MTDWRKRIFLIVSPHDDHSSKDSRIYDYFQLVAIVLSLVPLAFRYYTHFFAVLEYCCVSLFILDYALRWLTADYKLKKGWVSFLIISIPLRP
ncbi:MAG: hypothetical protein LIO91_01495 [Bacteroidales bacterium]|nr:hypothetical protein [Bacteroidales bacterium]